MRRRNLAKEDRSKYVNGNKYNALSSYMAFFLFFEMFFFNCSQADNWGSTKNEGKDSRNSWLSCFFSCPAGVFWPFPLSLKLVLLLSLWLSDYFFVWPQTCVKYCSQSEREAVFAELRPHLLTLACNTYAVHLLKKMIDTGMVMLLQLVYMFSMMFTLLLSWSHVILDDACSI